MPRVRSTWLVGSIEALPVQNFTIDAAASAIATGDYYLYAADGSLSLLSRFAAQMTAAGLAGVSVVILENRRVRLAASSTFSVTWGAATQLRGLLGFSGNLSGASSYTAESISPLLWSGGEVSRACPTGVTGYPVEDAEISVSADGSRQITTFYATHTHDDWTWEAVHLTRYWSTAGAGGTWHAFRTAVVVQGHRFQLFETVEEDTSSTTAVTWPTRIGVYKMREIPPGKGDRISGFESSNVYWKVSMSVRVSSEYT
jgi:hypothetical protein